MPLSLELDIFAPTMNPLLAFAVLGDLVVASRSWAQDVHREVRRYPPERAGQTYRRTYRLRNAWQVNGPHLNGGTLETTITNPILYSQFVHGNNFGQRQSWFHRGRWRTLSDLAQSVTPSLEVRCQAALTLRMQTALVTQVIRATP